MDDEDVAITIPEAFIYKIPARTSAEGHKASDWPKESVAVVRVQVATKGKDYFVKLYRTDNGKLFAVAPTRAGGPSAVEQVQDSSRYFALRIEDGKGNHAFIGLGFNKREDAFDLKSCLSDVEKSNVAQEKGVDLGLGDVSNDLLSGFGAGQSITLKVGKAAGSGGGGGGGGGGVGSGVAASGGGGLLRAPGRLAPPGSAPAAAATTGGSGGGGGGSGGGFDLLGMGGGSSVPAAAAPPPAAAPAAATEWETF